MILNCNGILLDLSMPKIMGILNLTNDSFYDGGRFMPIEKAKIQIDKLVSEGAAMVDIGAMSSRPGAKLSTPESEIQILLPTIDYMLNYHKTTIVSIDTLHAEVAKICIECGAHMINDVSGGHFDKLMWKTVGNTKAAYVMMHMKGIPETMHSHATYENLTMEVMQYFAKNIRKAQEHGIEDIIIDPGFGFSKNINHNFELLKKLNLFKVLELPILVGLSRKSMIYKTLHIEASEALNGTTSLNTIALQKGANILRVHDVKEARECINLFEHLR